MQILSVNVGLPREVEWRGELVSTAIFKAPVAGRVAVGRLNLAGDRQADLSVHGGPEKAIYAYSADHYERWRAELPGADLAWGAFGENLSVSGLAEADVNIGDEFRAGTALLRVTQPRMPCYKLGIRFGDELMVRRFLQSGRFGVYFAVLEEGEVGAGDSLSLARRDPHGLSVADIGRLYTSERSNSELLRRAAAHEHLAGVWRSFAAERLARLGSE